MCTLFPVLIPFTHIQSAKQPSPKEKSNRKTLHYIIQNGARDLVLSSPLQYDYTTVRKSAVKLQHYVERKSVYIRLAIDITDIYYLLSVIRILATIPYWYTTTPGATHVPLLQKCCTLSVTSWRPLSTEPALP